MGKIVNKRILETVALLAEGVDRNFKSSMVVPLYFVALLAEGVDRNHTACRVRWAVGCRPPRGGRG